MGVAQHDKVSWTPGGESSVGGIRWHAAAAMWWVVLVGGTATAADLPPPFPMSARPAASSFSCPPAWPQTTDRDNSTPATQPLLAAPDRSIMAGERLASVRVVEGASGAQDEESPADLAPDGQFVRAGRLVQVWSFVHPFGSAPLARADHIPTPPEVAAAPHLLVCSYAKGGRIAFALPATTTRCEASYKATFWQGAAVPVGARCH